MDALTLAQKFVAVADESKLETERVDLAMEIAKNLMADRVWSGDGEHAAMRDVPLTSAAP